MQDPDLSTATTELRMLLKRFVNDQNNIIFDAAMLMDDANNDQLRVWFRSLSLCISKVSFVNFIGSLRWINVMKSAFRVVGYVGYILSNLSA